MELDLELEWELKWELEWELVLKPRNPREFQPGVQKTALWVQIARLSIFVIENGPLGPLLEPLSKPEKWDFAPGDPLYNQRSQSRILTKSALSADPMVAIWVGTPPFSSISFLLTAHARNAPPSTVEAVRVVRAGWRPGSGRLGLGG